MCYYSVFGRPLIILFSAFSKTLFFIYFTLVYRIRRISAGGVFTVLAYYFAYCISRWKYRFLKLHLCKYFVSFRTGFFPVFQMDCVRYRRIPKHKLCDVTRVRLRAPGVTLVHPSNSTCPAAGRQCCQINKQNIWHINSGAAGGYTLSRSNLRSVCPHNLSMGVATSSFLWDFPTKFEFYVLFPHVASSLNHAENVPPWVSTDVWSTMFWSPN